MIVDDDDDARQIIREVLESEGYEVVEARNGRQALHYLTSEAPQPCLILLDLRMPEMTGWELLALLKAYSRLAAIPVVVTSGFDPHSEALPPGAFAQCLRKPITRDILLKAVSESTGRPRK
ncbi:MAG: response regulator [Myxococcaceae bacterium]